MKEATDEEIEHLFRDSPPMDISGWFSLTYASYLVIPRLWLESMPIEWQHQFVSLLEKIQDTLVIDAEYTAEYIVTCKRKGKFIKDPYRDYRRGHMELKK